MESQLRPERNTRNLRVGEEKKHLEMLNLCHNPWGDEQRWKRFYRQEGFDFARNVLVVEEKGEWVGGVTAWFREVFLTKDKTVKGYIAGDGYVLPSQRGRGLYSFYMKAVNEMAKRRGTALGFGFISAYNLPPLKALPKIGFVNSLAPFTKILALNPEGFFDYIITEWAREVQMPSVFEKMNIAIIVSFASYKGKVSLSKKFTVENGKLVSPPASPHSETDQGKTDLRVKTDIETLARIVKQFNAGKRILIIGLLTAALTRRLSLRFSFRLLRAVIKS